MNQYKSIDLILTLTIDLESSIGIAASVCTFLLDLLMLVVKSLQVYIYNIVCIMHFSMMHNLFYFYASRNSLLGLSIETVTALNSPNLTAKKESR